MKPARELTRIKESIDAMNNNAYFYDGGRPNRTAEDGITHVIVKDGVTSIDDNAFKNWKDLISVDIPSSVTTMIDREAFYGCSSLSSIDLPESLQRIDYLAFGGCVNLSEINLPNSLTDIGHDAFYDSSLSSITIPPSVSRIGLSIFSGCLLYVYGDRWYFDTGE